MNAYADSVLITNDGKAVSLERKPLVGEGESLFSEKWLQHVLFANPRALPTAEITPRLGTLIPICMELQTGAGPADLLYVTSGGQVVLVETKLWRNPEARREVVAQILDYAKQLAGWNYEDLAREVARATGQGSEHLLLRVRQDATAFDEANFVDGINRCLKSGDFLLLIVGDGIRLGAEALVGFLQQYGSLRFDLALIEVAVFTLPGGNTLLQPRVLAKTEVLQRTVLIGPSGPLEFEQVAAAEDTEPRNNAQSELLRGFWIEFMNKLVLDDQTQPRQPPAKSTNQFFPMPPGGASAWVSTYLAQAAGKAGVYLTCSKSFPRASEYFDRLMAERNEIEETVGKTLDWSRTAEKFYISAPDIKMGDLSNLAIRQELIADLADTTRRFINAFRHRLDGYSREST